MDIRIISTAFAIGVYLSDRIGFVNILIMGISVFFVCAARLIFRMRVVLMIPLTVIAFVLGAGLYKFAALDEFNKTSEYMHKKVTAKGVICDIPHQTGEIMKYIVDIRSISDGTEDTELKEKIIVYSETVFDYGDVICVTGTIKPVPQKLNESGFDTSKYYKRRGITGRMNAETAEFSAAAIANRQPGAAVTKVRYNIDKLIDKYYSGDRAAVLKAVITGNKNEFSDEMNNVLVRTSTRSLLYPAYIHIMLINMLVGCASSVVNRKHRDTALAFLFIIYMLINIDHASFVRGCMFAAVTTISRRFFKREYYPDTLSAVVLTTGIMNPLMLYDAGYVTSAAGSVIVRAFYPYVKNRRFLRTGSLIKRTIAIHLICTAGLIPLTAYYFNSISVYSVIAATVFFPAVIGIIAASPIFLLSIYFTGGAPVSGQFMTAMTSLIMKLPYIIDRLPFSRIYIQTPSIALLISCFAALTALWYTLKNKIKNAKITAASAAVLLLMCGVRSVMRINTVEVDFVNVGQGDGAVVSVPFGANLLIDGGGSPEFSDYDTGARIYLPYLVEKGVTTVDAAFVSHYHKDHVQGIVAAIDNIKVKNLFIPGCMPESEWRVTLEKKAMEHNTKIWYISANTTVAFNDGLTVDITVPDAETKLSKDENDTSLLINVSYGEFNCLFTGDMTAFAEKNLVRKGKAFQSEVLKVAHHGSKKSTSAEFFEAVSPDYAVISLGENNSYNFPDKEVLEGIDSAEILRTDLNGDIRIISDKNGNIKVHTFK